MGLEELKLDLITRSKKGLPFIITSIIIWALFLLVWMSPIKSIETKNLLTFMVTALLMPISILVSKIIKAEIFIKDNPLNKIGFIFTLNQMLYILIAMWAYSTNPDKMLMILAMIFGAHLLPYGWLYNSKAYTLASIFITLFSLIIGTIFNQIFICAGMVIIEIIFSTCLFIELKYQKNCK